MLFNKSALLVAVCAALTPSASAVIHTINSTVYPSSGCTGTNSTATFPSGTCHNIGPPAKFSGRFSIVGGGPISACLLTYYNQTGCGGMASVPIPVSSLVTTCDALTFPALNPTPPPVTITSGALSVNVTCVL